MLQIKTIKRPFNHMDSFDEEVNAALAEGWRLTKRAVIGPYQIETDAFNVWIMLYAELERYVITEAERCCENCRYCDCDSRLEPCINCNDNADKWEAADA